MSKLLVEGYIHEIEARLNKQIVPKEIVLLCIEYYYANSKIVYLSDIIGHNQFSLYLTDIAADTSKEIQSNNTRTNTKSKPKNIESFEKVWKCNLSKFNTLDIPSYTTNTLNEWNLSGSAVCSKKNIKFPSFIDKNLKFKTGNNAIFKCGGLSPNGKSCSVYIINEQCHTHDYLNQGMFCTYCMLYFVF